MAIPNWIRGGLASDFFLKYDIINMYNDQLNIILIMIILIIKLIFIRLRDHKFKPLPLSFLKPNFVVKNLKFCPFIF